MEGWSISNHYCQAVYHCCSQQSVGIEFIISDSSEHL
uniref:Uncharacterized protein n=1 Tax=Arundo donax TaxID=35708 RepID=A0A0A9HPC5_ARUDO